VWSAAARKREEARVLHLDRVQAVATAVTKELLRVGTEREAYELACRIAVEHGHFRFAWVGLVSAAESRVVPVARAGHEDGYLDEIMVTTDASARGRGPVGRAIRDGVHAVVNDTARDATFVPWQEPARRRGYHGCAAFPLRRDGVVIGALAIYAAEENRFDEEQIDLLLGLADDIGFKIDAIAAEAHRRDAEAALRTSEERYRALVELAADAIFIVERNDTVVEVNAAMCEISGYTREELMGMKSEAFIDPSETRPRLLLGQAPGARPRGERRMRRKDGTVVEAEITATVLADGRIHGYLRDVTQRNVMQQKLILADRLASLGRLAAGVAHEVNNPLAYVALNIERVAHAASRGDASQATLDDVRIAAAEAKDGVERVRAVVRALGALGREDEDAVSSVDVHRVLDTAVRLAENRARHRGRIVKDYGAKRGARGNELRLGQVFVNLLINAADALREDAAASNEIVVRTYDEGSDVVIEVRDNGAGIPEEIAPRIFDPFFTTKPVGEGTGLGLAISHGIVTSFGGSIAVESEVGKGSIFRVRLVAESRAAAASSVSPRVEKRELSRARARVLIIDDEPHLVRVLAMSLDEHEVSIATSGRQGLAMCEKTDFDCIVCDLMMPDVSGMDVYAELAREGKGRERRMIFMTGGAFTARARAFASSVSNVVLEKPFMAERLSEEVAILVGSTRAAR
jgi:PAS domain S-box-containing protein